MHIKVLWANKVKQVYQIRLYDRLLPCVYLGIVEAGGVVALLNI